MLAGEDNVAAQSMNSNDQMNYPSKFPWNIFQCDDIPNFSPPYHPQTVNVEEFGPTNQPTALEEHFGATEHTYQVATDPEQGEIEEDAA